MIVVVVFADTNFGQMAEADRRAVWATIQGVVEQLAPDADAVLVWQDAAGRMNFITPPQQERFFQTMKYDQLYVQADRSVTVTPA